MSKFFNSFRIRFLLVLVILLFGTLIVQYWLNLQAERNMAQRQAEQAKALMAGITLGVRSINSKDYLYQIRDQSSEPLPELIQNIMSVDENWQVRDSLDKKYLPVQDGDKIKYVQLRDINDLPAAILALNIAGDTHALPPNVRIATSLSVTRSRSFFVPIEGVTTSNNREVTWYLIVVIGPKDQLPGILSRRAARPLAYTLLVLLIATSLAGLLVWRFTQPMAALSLAARKVAGGQFNFRVATKRRDEMGQLIMQFNEMVSGLERGKELEMKLSQAERSAVVGRLASGIAHEIRNPLNYINLTLDRLRTSYKPADETKIEKYVSHLKNLKEEVKRINKLVTDFLSFTRPRELEMESLDLREELYDALRIVEDLAFENNIKTEINLSGNVTEIIGDKHALHSVFTNLFINAVQAIGIKGGALIVDVNVQDDNKNVRIEIKDTGSGIQPENLPKLFEPYFSTKETGTGLGLAIVKKNIEEHNGTIDVQSVPDEGTTIIVTLPIRKEG